MYTRWIALLTLSMIGCRDKVEDTGTTNPETNLERTLEVYGQASWDPMVAQLEGSEEVLAAEVNGVALQTELSTVEGTYGFRDDLSVGDHAITHPEALTEGALVHTVLPYGRGESFDPESIVGVPFTMDLDSPWIPAPDGLGNVMLSLIDGVWLEVVSVDGDEAVFEVFTRAAGDEDYPICRALRAKGTLSATGELTWETAALDIDDDNPLLRDLSIRGGWLEDASLLGGVEGTAILHTALISRELVEGEVITQGSTPESTVCEYLQGFGTSCYDCLGDGTYCIDIAFHAGVMSPWDDSIPKDPPSCGIDTEDIGPIKCELPDFTCAASFFGLLGLTGMLRRRRRE
ncbi:MAG: hypothetical protein ACI8RZ_006105 [Myxococcota bacterium]|jgi:hypothetical protein